MPLTVIRHAARQGYPAALVALVRAAAAHTALLAAMRS